MPHTKGPAPSDATKLADLMERSETGGTSERSLKQFVEDALFQEDIIPLVRHDPVHVIPTLTTSEASQSIGFERPALHP